MKQCNCCHNAHPDSQLVDDTCYDCHIKCIYKPYTGIRIPDWIMYHIAIDIPENSTVLIENVDLRAVRYSIRELLSRMYPGRTIILLNINRNMFGVIHRVHFGMLMGITFYSTLHVDKISPELAISLKVADTREAGCA